MDFLGVGPLEFLFILIIALVVIGPRDLGKYARSAGRFLNRLYRSETWRVLTETSRNLRTLPNRLAREAALEELDDVRHSIQGVHEELTAETQALDEGLKAWMKPSISAPSEPDDHRGQSEDTDSEPPNTSSDRS
jgi:Sec-independent protein translocase protein TatA